MNLKITFTIKDENNKDKKVSKTFTNVNKNASDDNLIDFAKNYMALTNIVEYKLEKITSEILTPLVG